MTPVAVSAASRSCGFGDAEVDELRDPRIGDEHVLRRDVAMNDRQRRALAILELVRRMDAAEMSARMRRTCVIGSGLPRRSSERRTRWSDPFDVFHREVEHAVLLAEVEDLLATFGGRCAPRSALRRGTSTRIRGCLRAEERCLEGHESLEATRPMLAREPFRRHASLSDGREQQVVCGVAAPPRSRGRNRGDVATTIEDYRAIRWERHRRRAIIGPKDMGCRGVWSLFAQG